MQVEYSKLREGDVFFEDGLVWVVAKGTTCSGKGSVKVPVGWTEFRIGDLVAAAGHPGHIRRITELQIRETNRGAAENVFYVLDDSYLFRGRDLTLVQAQKIEVDVRKHVEVDGKLYRLVLADA